jgi:hypothetical protein
MERDPHKEAFDKLERLCDAGCSFRSINDRWAIFDKDHIVIGSGDSLFAAIRDASE